MDKNRGNDLIDTDDCPVCGESTDNTYTNGGITNPGVCNSCQSNPLAGTVIDLRCRLASAERVLDKISAAWDDLKGV